MQARSRGPDGPGFALSPASAVCANSFPDEGHAARDEAQGLNHTSHGDLRARCGGSAESPIRVLLSEGITRCK
jgi:hypothetical protein